MKYLPIDKNLFVENRKRFTSRMKPKSIAIFNSNDEMPRSADGSHAYRQNSDMFYLTGIDQEQSILVLFPDCPNPVYKEMLFIRRTNDHIAVWEGHKYTMDEAKDASGINIIYWTDEFETMLPAFIYMAETLYLNMNEHPRYSGKVPYKDLRFAREMQLHFPLHHYERSAPVITALRMIKSSTEINLIKHAVGITEKAFRRILKMIKPGAMEYEIEAEITHEFVRNRATGHAYSPIVASGKNGCVLHYIANSNECKDGEILVMDFGAEYANYAADLTRCVPVNGKFTKRQKDVYNAVLRVMKGATKMLTIGNHLEAYHKEVGKIMEEELIGLGLLNADEVKKQDTEKPLYKKYFMHGTSHYLGLDVHDVGGRFDIMQAGTVFTCEPGIYIPDEGFGIRLENDILITEHGPVDLMANIPVEAEEIEELMSSRS